MLPITRLGVLALALSAGSTTISGQEKAAVALSAAQRESIQQIMQSAEKATKIQAEAPSRKVGELAKRIDENLLAERADHQLHARLSAELTEAVVALVRVAVQAKLHTVQDLVKVLTPQQKALLLAELAKPGTNPDLTELIGKVFGETKK